LKTNDLPNIIDTDDDEDSEDEDEPEDIIKEWHHVVKANNFTNKVTTNASDPQVAFNNNGEAIIVWAQHDQNSDQIFMAERAAKGTWTIPENITDKISNNASTARHPRVAINTNGLAIITWQQHDGLNDSIYKAERNEDGEWDFPEDTSDRISVYDGGANTAYDPEVALNDNGKAIITWSQYVNSVSYGFISERNEFGVWNHPDDLTDHIFRASAVRGFSDLSYMNSSINSDGNIIFTYGTFNQGVSTSEYR
jgi:uncharacterized protein YpmB